jgi:hypothetical protein
MKMSRRASQWALSIGVLVLGLGARMTRGTAHGQTQQGPMGQGWVQPVTPPQLDCFRRNGPFAWNCAGPPQGAQCTQIVEPADPDTWNDNYFCTTMALDVRWSFSGPIHGMRCTQIFEYADPHTWNDNYLCVPPTSPVHFAWSEAGPLAGMQCLQWIEPADPHTWNDNYLCWAFAR